MAEKKHGGARPGAGRKPGSLNRATAEARQRAEEGGILPLDFMLRIMRDEGETKANRMDMAKAAAPYVHAKLSSIEASGPDGGPIPIQAVEWKIVDPRP